MVDFLKGLSFLILPLGLGSKRMDFFEKQITKYSGGVRDKTKPSHVIIEESVGESKEKCLMALKTNGVVLSDDIVIVGTKWLSKCIGEKRIVDTKPFEFAWMAEILPSEGTSSDGRPTESTADFSPSPRKKTKIESEKYICSQSSVSNFEISDKKKMIISELRKLADAFAARKDTWRAYSYENAIRALTQCDHDISTYQEASKIPGIGERMASKIMEILESGKLTKVEEIVDEKTKVLELFCNVWGAGPTTAENWYLLGYRTLDDLRNKAKLTKQQEIGLKFYDDFMERMTREQVERIGSVVAEELKHVHGHCRTELVGSYRRGKVTCGDVDVMVVNPGPKNPADILLQLTDRLRDKGYLTDDLVSLNDLPCEDSHRKYLGVFRFPGEGGAHRRIDIFVVPKSQYAAALMHYTGSAMYNRSVRLFASRKGLTLNEHGLYAGVIRKGSDILNEGKLVPTPTEKDIFDYLGLDYKAPEERDH
ncbi:UNVERIFIED_CONTAM: hypothetical protein PYX00_007542 [Menopon gallinae]|uniref:DNA polymerase n=1 Tax=Menopon gallinae TaxID=328185 RepID=A0AAW2HJC4_9NEOP